MSIGYLCDKSWLQTTREERQFCAALFNVVRENPQEFIRLINQEALPQRPKVKALDDRALWEVGFEVALGRDLRKPDLSEIGSHRKFDLALFSGRQMVVVEAKAQQGFLTAELERFSEDRATLKKALPGIRVCFLGLCSGDYLARKQLDLSIGFDKVLTWQSVACRWSDEHFKRADSVYSN